MARRRLLAAALACAVAVGVLAGPEAGSVTVVDSDPVLVAVGDIACDPLDLAFNLGLGTATQCRQAATAKLADEADPDVVAVLGDNQYEGGLLSALLGSYDLSWGRLKSITRPAVGNHEYSTAGAAGHFGYFGTRAGSADKGYYSYDLGAWHVVVLNSNCSKVSCAQGSAQEKWLRADLAANPRRCTLAYFHHPRYSSGSHGDTGAVWPFWRALYDYRADVVLAGHDHGYERFAKIRPDGTRDGEKGIRSWVVGTGGKSLYKFGTPDPNSLVRYSGGFGVLKLRLGKDGYTWRFLGEPGTTFSDTGTGTCRA
jgi:acid phosphatase type 7